MPLPVIGIGKRGGKIVGYDKKGQPIYQGSKAAQKLEVALKKPPKLTPELKAALRMFEDVADPDSDRFRVTYGDLGLETTKKLLAIGLAKWGTVSGNPPDAQVREKFISDYHPIQLTERGERLIAAARERKAKPKLVSLAQGWPRKKDTYTVKHPGVLPTDPKIKWPAGYPGEGFKAETTYKGKQYKVEFLERNGKIAVKVTYPNKSTRTWDSPNKASDSMYLHAQGLPLDMSATEKRKRKISLPAKTAFGINKFKADLPLKPGKNAKDRTLAELEASGEVPADAVEVDVGAGGSPRAKRPVDDKGKTFRNGDVIKKKRKGLGEVDLALLASDKFEVRYTHPKTGKVVVRQFKSISSASDHVWLASKGYKSRQDYQAQTGQTRIKSGGGWKFWGLRPEQVTWLTPDPPPVGEVSTPPPEQVKKQMAREKESDPGWERMPEVEAESKEGRPKANDAPDPVEDKKAKASTATFTNRALAVDAMERKMVETDHEYHVVEVKKGVFEVRRKQRELSAEEKARNKAMREAQGAEMPEGVEMWDDELAYANMKQWGNELQMVQVASFNGQYYEKDAAGFSVSDMHNWDWVVQSGDLLAMKVMLKKYKRQLISMYGDGYWQAGLGENIPGWDEIDQSARKKPLPEFKADMGEIRKRALALNWEYPLKPGKGGFGDSLLLDADYPLEAGDVIRVITSSGEHTEQRIRGFNRPFRSKWGPTRGQTLRYAQLEDPPRAAQAPEFSDQEVGNPQEKKPPTGPDFAKTYQTRMAGKRRDRLITQLPTDHGMEVGDVIKVRGVASGYARVTGMGGAFDTGGRKEQYVDLEPIQASEAGRGQPAAAMSEVEKAVKQIRSGRRPNTLAVTFDPDSGKWSFHAGFSEEYNFLMGNRNGQISGITEFNPENKARETLDLSLVEEVMQKVKDQLGWEVVPDQEALDKAIADRAAKAAELRKPIPEVEAMLGTTPAGDKFTLYPYQNEGVKFLQKTDGNALIGDEMGLGKTLQTLAWAATQGKKVLVVCPKAVRRNWVREGEKFFPGYFRGKELSPAELRKQRAKTRAAVAAGGETEAIDALVAEARDLAEDLAKYNLVSINYESVAKYADALKAAGYDTIVIDESHRIKNPKAKITKTLQRMAPQFKHHILLSGTAIKNKKEELYPQINMVKPGLFRSAKALKCDTIGGTWNKLQEVYIARQKMKVLSDMPDKVRQIVSTPMTGAAANNPDLGLDLVFRNIARIKEALAQTKVDSTIDMAKEIIASSDDNVIVFSESVKAVEAIAKALGDDAVIHHGGMRDEPREQAKVAFQEEGKGRVFVTTRQSMAEGANLQRASHVVFNDLPWTPASIAQAEDRAHRIGQKKNVQSYWMTAEHPLDERITELIERKITLSLKVTQGKQLTPEEMEWMDADLTIGDLRAALNGEDTIGEDAAKEPSPAGWERFQDVTIPWKQSKKLAQDKVQKMPPNSMVKIDLQVAPSAPVRTMVYEKISTDNWVLWDNGERKSQSIEDAEVAQVANHWPQHGGTVHYSTPLMKRKPAAEKDAPPKPKGFSKYKSILIPSKNEAWADMLTESGIDDHDMAVYDASYQKYLESGNKSDLPPPYTQGEMDAVNEQIRGAGIKLPSPKGQTRDRVSGPLEGFHELLKARMQEMNRKRPTWEDVEALLPIFRDIPGFEKLRLPPYATNILVEARLARKLAEQQAEMEGAPEPEPTLDNPDGPEVTDPDNVPFDISDSGPEGYRGLSHPTAEQLDALPVGAMFDKDLDPDVQVQVVKLAPGKWQSKVTDRPSKLYESTAELAGIMREVERQLDDTRWWLDEASAAEVTTPEPEASEPPPAPAAAARRYYYGMPLRPPGPGAQPKGEDFKIESGPDAKDRNRRHGVVSYAAPLDPDQARRMDLVPLLDAEQITEAVDKVVAEMADYAAEHLELASEDPKYMRQAIASAVEHGLGHVDLGNWDTFQDRVTEALAQVAAEQGVEETPGPGVAADRPSAVPQSAGASEAAMGMADGKIDLAAAKKNIAAAGLVLRESMTRPTRAGKQPRKVWEVSGQVAAYREALEDAGGRKWKGKYSFWEDPTIALGEALKDAEKLSVAEQLEDKREKAEERADRQYELAGKARDRRDAAHDTARSIGDKIPFGQPILVGHHSEARARRDANKIHTKMNEVVSEQKKAEYHEQRAQAAEKNASGDRSKGYLQRRIDEYEARVRSLDRTLADPDMDPESEYYHLTVARRRQAQEYVDHYKAELEAKGGVKYTKADMKAGDVVQMGGENGKKAVVVRAGAKNVTVRYLEGPPSLKGQEVRTPYVHITAHFPATEESKAQAKPKKLTAAALKPGPLDWKSLQDQFGKERWGGKWLNERDVLNAMPTGSKITHQGRKVAVEKIGRGKYRVYNTNTGAVVKEETSLDRAENSLRGALDTPRDYVFEKSMGPQPRFFLTGR